jgi:hypothetical protein
VEGDSHLGAGDLLHALTHVCRERVRGDRAADRREKAEKCEHAQQYMDRSRAWKRVAFGRLARIA